MGICASSRHGFLRWIVHCNNNNLLHQQGLQWDHNLEGTSMLQPVRGSRAHVGPGPDFGGYDTE